jgi:hypothetical protein
VPLFGVAVSYAVGAVDWHRQWAILASGDPVIDCPETIRLAEQEVGQIAVARFILANRGRAGLRIDDVRTNCSCSGLEQETDGEFTRVDSLRLKPGERKELAIRISVRGQVATAVRNAVTFTTNDPTQPTARIEVIIPKITGGILAAPSSLVFAAVPVGGQARQTFEVRDTAACPRRIAGVRSTQPERFDVRFLAPAAGAEAEKTAGKLLGRVEVVLHTREPGPVDGAVLVQLDDPARPPDTVPVTGRVAALVEALPPSVVLPRASEAGPVYWARCICRSTEGRPLKLELAEAPAGISAAVSAAEGGSGLRAIRIECKPDAIKSAGPEKVAAVRFRAWFGDKETRLTIPVLLRAQPPRQEITPPPGE